VPHEHVRTAAGGSLLYGELMARLAYLGTPDVAVPPLRALRGAGHDIAIVVTRADKRRGRGRATTPSPVKAAALDLALPVTHQLADVVAAGVELGVVVAYGRLIPAALLEKVPMLNLHFSLLPRWRGAAPVERAILAGDRETGVCAMKIEEGLDTGPIYANRVVPVDDAIPLEALRRQLVDVGSALLVDMLARGVDGLPVPAPQVGEATIADKITTEDLHLQWAEPARQLRRVVRLGRAWTTFRGRRLTVLEASVDDAYEDDRDGDRLGPEPGTLLGAAVVTGDGALVLRRVQPDSRSPMSAEEWLRGVRPAHGERLGTD
jgi:methionyl-tRNA formyltransferase